MTDKTTALLIRARGFIERGWCRYALARDENGCAIGPQHFKAVAWCAKGALIAAGVGCFSFPLHPAVRRLRRAICGGNISLFSDHQKNAETVLAAFDRAIAYLIRDRLSFMRFLGLGLADTVPDANTIWTFREALTRAKLRGKPAIEVLFKRFDDALTAAGFLAMGGQIVDATIVAAPKQRNTDGEKREIKEGRIPAEWAKKPAKLRQKDRDARWTVKYTKAKPSEDGAPRVDLAVPAFGYKNHIGIDRRHRLIRSWAATDASRHDGALLPALIDKDNTASDVWADTAYRSKANEKHLADNGLRSQIHRKKPKGKPMPRRTARANGRKSAVRAAVEHVFARQKGPMGLYIRTIGIARARTKIGLANLVYNMKRMVWLIAQAAPA
jgi:transposase, IS5 family